MNRIKELREKMGLKQSDLATLFNVRQNSISNWETGRHDPDLDRVDELAALFGVSTDYLLGRDEKKKPTTVSSDGPAQKIANALRDLGVDVDNLTESDIRRFAKLGKTLFEEQD